MLVLKAAIFVVVIGGAGILALRIAFPLPDTNFAEATYSLPANLDGPLGKAIQPALQRHPNQNGVRPLAEGRGAFAARAILAREAVSSIDAQYYIWQDDTTGLMLLEELRAAAERGVRVRLLVDDNGIPGLDALMAELDAMPTAEVRIFNPFTMRSPKLLSYFFDFHRLNRRMHNKSMIVDGVASIVGGRNVGDIYFAYGDGTHYFDIDAITIGPVVAEIFAAFDKYWNSDAVYAADRVLAAPSTAAIENLAATARKSDDGAVYQQAVADNALTKSIEQRSITFEWGEARLFVDDPAKGLGEAAQDKLLVEDLVALAEETDTSLDLVSAYFIPGPRGEEVLTRLANRGVRVRVLTNSLDATDVMPVHAAYMGYRKALLRSGVELQELRSLRDERVEMSLPEILAGSASGLHAKVFGFDGNRVFIGSYNLDPRSAQLNCEMGLLVESPNLAAALAQQLSNHDTVYRLELDKSDKIRWIGETHGEERVYSVDPETSALQRGLARLVALLPIEWML
ncbi:phospholipase D family protein [Halovulum sp. GXIMD14794]